MKEFENVFLPLYLDYNPEMKTVTFEKPAFGTKEYYLNHQCFLEINTDECCVFIDYYSEDDIFLSELLDLETDCIAKGRLKKETFAQIQSRALQVISTFIEDAEEQIMELFES